MNIQSNCCRILLTAFLGLAFAASEDAHSTTTTCISDGDIAGLQSALSAAAGNGDDDLIQLQIGHYSMPSSFGWPCQ